MPPSLSYLSIRGVFLVLELLSGQRSVADMAPRRATFSRKEGIKDTLLHEWRSEFIRNAPMLFSAPQAQADQMQAQKVSELEQVKVARWGAIGRLTMAPRRATFENEALKKASRWLNGLSGQSERSH